MEKQELDPFRELIELIPKIVGVGEICIQKELKLYPHNFDRLKEEMDELHSILGLIQGKWTMDILYLLLIKQTLYFNLKF